MKARIRATKVLILVAFAGALGATSAFAVESTNTTSVWGIVKDAAGDNVRNMRGQVCTTGTFNDGEESIPLNCIDVTTDNYGQFRFTQSFYHSAGNSPFGANDIHVESYKTVFKPSFGGEISGQVDSWAPRLTYKAWHLLLTNTRAYTQKANFKFNLPYYQKCHGRGPGEVCQMYPVENLIMGPVHAGPAASTENTASPKAVARDVRPGDPVVVAPHGLAMGVF